MAVPAPAGQDSLARILAMFSDAEDDLNRRLRDVMARGPEWYREQRRLRELRDAARARMREIRRAMLVEDIEDGLGAIYARGAVDSAGILGELFGWSQPHLGAVNRVASDTFEDLLQATRYVEDSTKTLIRQAAKLETSRKLLEGRTANQAAKILERSLLQSGIGVVTYRNGARFPVSAYTEMVMRTKSAVAYNMGSINHGAAAGVEVFECSDGADCGFTYHEDVVLANGLIVSPDTAAAWPVSHPNCVRVWLPRPDLKKKDITEGARDVSTSPEALRDQQRFEDFMKDQRRTIGTGRRLKREPRAKRADRPGHVRKERKPRTPRKEPAPAPTPTPVPEPSPPAPVTGTGTPVEAGRALDDVGARHADDAFGWDGSTTGPFPETPIEETMALREEAREALRRAGYSDEVIEKIEESAAQWKAGQLVDFIKQDWTEYRAGTYAGKHVDFFDIAAATKIEAPLFRGVALTTEQANRLAVGDLIEDTLSSWSRNDGVADLFAHTQSTLAGSKTIRVKMRLEGGVHGIDVSALNMRARFSTPYAWQHEVAVGARLEVTSVRKVGANEMEITVREVPLAAKSTARATVARPAAGTSKLTDSFEFEGARAREFESYARRMDEIHGIRSGPEKLIVRHGGRATRKGGHYSPAKAGPKPRRKRTESREEYVARFRAYANAPRQAEIKILDLGDGSEVASFLHEYGHRVDDTGIGKWLSADLAHAESPAARDAMRDFLLEAKNSDALRIVTQGQSFENRRYFQDPRELWARAYSQWAAGKLGGAASTSLERMLTGGRWPTGYQWSHEEFRKIAPLVEAVLRARGLMT